MILKLLLIAIFLSPLFIVYKIWRWNFLTKTISLIIIAFYSLIICQLECDMCGLEREEAYQRVVKDIKKRDLDIDKIKFVKNIGSCRYDFRYSDDNKRIYYAIILTWLHGVKTSYEIEELNSSRKR